MMRASFPSANAAQLYPNRQDGRATAASERTATTPYWIYLRGGSAEPTRPARWAISASDRSAALTDAAFGNRSDISGSSTTTFDLARSRLTYFPRTNAPKSERLYSARSSPLV